MAQEREEVVVVAAQLVEMEKEAMEGKIAGDLLQRVASGPMDTCDCERTEGGESSSNSS